MRRCPHQTSEATEISARKPSIGSESILKQLEGFELTSLYHARGAKCLQYVTNGCTCVVRTTLTNAE